VLTALTMALLGAGAAPPAGAQTATSTSGDVGSAVSRNGYPAGGGAIVLPSGSATTATGAAAATGASGTATTTTASGGASGSSAGGSGGSGGGGRTGTAPAGGASPSPGTGGGGTHWVLCPPTGSSGLSPLFTGTDLSCTPD